MQIPPLRLLHDTLVHAARSTPGKIAIVDEGTPHTYLELFDGASRLASAMRSRGLARGDRVVIYMSNSFACAVAIYATLMAGGVFVLVNPLTKSDKLAFVIDDCAARVFVTEARLRHEYSSHLTAHASLTAVICSGDPGMVSGNGAPVESFAEVVASAVPLTDRVGTVPVDLAALIYTSGSTGNPKGVMMTHQNMLFTVGSLLEYLRLDAGHTILCVLPLAFDYGLYQLLMCIGAGATLVLERSFTFPAKVIERMLEHGVTVFPAVPTIFAMLIEMHRRSPLRFPGVMRVTNTAASLPVSYQPLLAEMFPAALLYRMYGLTECKRVSYLEPELVATKGESVGKAIPGTETMVLRPDGTHVAPGETGVLHVRGPHVMVGYWGRPVETAKMLVPGALPGERVLNTQDFFRVDGDGFLYFVGRSDDIIKTRGEKVSPVEVENCLYAMPGVLEAAVVGVHDELLGQAVRAYVVLDKSMELGERAVRGWCSARLEAFMVPKEIVVMDSLPKTTSGKIAKSRLGREA